KPFRAPLPFGETLSPLVQRAHALSSIGFPCCKAIESVSQVTQEGIHDALIPFFGLRSELKKPPHRSRLLAGRRQKMYRREAVLAIIQNQRIGRTQHLVE